MGVSVNWLSATIFVSLISPIYWLVPTKTSVTVNYVVSKLHYEFKNLLGPDSFQGRTTIFIGLFLFLLINNFIGLLPYIFTASSHLTITLAISLPLWISFILYGWVNYTKHIFAHLVPQRTPGALIPFIVLIETIRNIIRPGTLAVRLIANIVAGHLLITLLGNQTAVASNFILGGLIFTQILLLTLECAVAVIQSYVFAVLSTLYAREITSH
jgi:F-type H+-transporting ATPase subunit a